MPTCRSYAGKRGTTWYYVRDDGTDPATGKRRQTRVSKDGAGKPFPSKKRCTEAMQDDLAKRRAPSWIEPSSEPASAYMARWLAERTDLRPATIVSYRNAWERLEPTLGTIPLGTLTPLDVQRAVRTAEATYSAGSVRVAHTVLSSALRQAVRWRLLPHNPAEGVILPAAAPKPAAVWTAAEARAFLAKTASAPEYPLWQLLLDSMMRIGEALALTWADADLESDPPRVTVARTLTQSDGEGWVIGATTKTGDRRTLSLSPATAAALRSHRTRQKARRLQTGPLWQATNLIFDRGDGGRVDPSVISRRFTRQQATAGVPHITPHGLRHTAATLAVLDGMPLKLVAARLGHKGIALVATLYAHATEEGDRRVSEALARVLTFSKRDAL